MAKKKTNFGRINKALFGNQQQITNVVKNVATKPVKYIVTECYNILKNMWAEPDYVKLTITAEAWYKLVAFINLVGDFEITGFGRIQSVPTENGVMHLVTDFDIIKQEVKPAYVEADEDAVLQFLMKLPEDQRDEWTLDWHSHVEMGTTPSGTDWNNYSEMLATRMGKQFPSMIVNKKGHITAQQIISDNRHPSIQVMVQQKALPESDILKIYNECKDKVERLCTEYVAPVTTYKPTYASQTTSNIWAGYAKKSDAQAVEDYDDYEYYGQYTGYGTQADVEEDLDCHYCGAKASSWHTQQLGVAVCKDCYDDLVRM